MNKEDFGAVKNLYESIINEAPLRDEPLWDGPGNNRPAGPEKAKPKPSAPGNEKPGYSGPPTPGTETAPLKPTSVKPAKPGTSSPANATTAQKIKGGMEVYKSQIKSGNTKGAEETGKATWALKNPTLAAKVNADGTQKGTGQSKMSQQAAELRDMQKASQGRQQGANVISDRVTSVRKDVERFNKPEVLNKPAPAGSALAAQQAQQAKAKATAAASAVKPTPSTSPIKKPGAVMSSFEWGTMSTIKDVSNLYASIYEGKKKDQDGDKDKDFADVMIARMMASGMSRAEAIAAVKNKEYNEEFVTEDPVQDFRDMRRAKENAAGLRGSELSNSARPAGSAAQKPQPRSREFEKVLPSGSKPKPSGGGSAAMRTTGPSSPGYDTRRLGGSDLRRLSNSYEFEGSMVDEATRMRKELGKEGETATRKELAARSKAYNRSGSVDKTIAAAERGAARPYIKHKRDESDEDRKKREEKQSRTLRGLASSRRGSVRDKPRVSLRGYAAKVEGSDRDLQRARSSAMSAGTLTPKEKKQLGEEYAVYEIVASYLLENNFAETLNDANVIIENMSETWVAQILESF